MHKYLLYLAICFFHIFPVFAGDSSGPTESSSSSIPDADMTLTSSGYYYDTVDGHTVLMVSHETSLPNPKEVASDSTKIMGDDNLKIQTTPIQGGNNISMFSENNIFGISSYLIHGIMLVWNILLSFLVIKLWIATKIKS